jgi:hypothetical protein
MASGKLCSDEEDKFFPIIITHEDVHTGLVTTSFIDMAVVNMATCENITYHFKLHALIEEHIWD